MKGKLLALCFLFAWAVVLQAQTPTITAVYGEAGKTSPLCPGGIAFIEGTNLGSTATTVTAGGKQAYVFNAFSGTSLQVQLPVDAPLGATTIKAGDSTPFDITLVQYSPGMPISNPGSVAVAFHVAAQLPVSGSFPATPNEQIAVFATGLGPTNPVFATGTAPNDTSAVVVTMPTVSVAGKAATVVNAYLEPHNPGFYGVVFTMPADVATGAQSISVSIGGLTSNTGNIPVAIGPVIASASNAATYIVRGPRYGVPQGAIFVLKGINLGPTDISIAKKPFQDTTLSGTSVSVTVSGTTVAALMYYTSSGQLAALLPSNTPVGVGTVTVTYNGVAGPSAPIRVYANSVGIFTVKSDGEGSGIVTYPDYSLVSTAKGAKCGGVYTTCGAANPGDVLTIWATGLGAVTGDDATGAGLGVNMPAIPLSIWLGDVEIKAIYQGRSGCCIGEDQIVFKVPPNAPTGCAVPLTVQINNFVSNSVALPMALAGSRTCTPVNPALTTDTVLQTLGDNPVTYGVISLNRQDNLGQNNTPGFRDVFEGEFFRVTIAAKDRPFFFSYLDPPPPGSCQIFNTLNGGPDPPIATLVGLDAGPQITLNGPNGSKNVSGSQGEYRTELSASGNYLSVGAYTVSVPGGADVPAFNATIAIPDMPVMTSPPPDATTPFSVTRANGLTVTWSGGSPDGYIQLDGCSATDNTFSYGASFTCLVPAGSGTFTIPPRVMFTMPPQNFGGLNFHPGSKVCEPHRLGSESRVPGTARYDYFTPLAFK